jgi:hypothetical protein
MADFLSCTLQEFWAKLFVWWQPNFRLTFVISVQNHKDAVGTTRSGPANIQFDTRLLSWVVLGYE